MDTHLTKGLQNCVGHLWGKDDFSDFDVVVDGTTYRCHRFILSACSDFFQGLFRSRMKEFQQNSVKLEGINKDTFDVIINSVYRGINGLTKNNFLEVWKGAEQLQILYLIELCEQFAIKHVCAQNCFDVLSCSTAFYSMNVNLEAVKCIAENFETLKATNEMMQLPFHALWDIINSDDLKADFEDSVLETIINWLEHHESFKKRIRSSTDSKSGTVKSKNMKQPSLVFFFKRRDKIVHNSIQKSSSLHQKDNAECCEQSCLPKPEMSPRSSMTPSTSTKRKQKRRYMFRDDRKQHLYELISTSRLCLVSSVYLERLLKNNEMLKFHKNTYELLLDAFSFSLKVNCRHEYWPQQAIHRFCSSKSHVMLWQNGASLEAFDFQTNQVCVISNFNSYRCLMIVFDETLYYVPYTDYSYGYSVTLNSYTKEGGTICLSNGNPGQVLKMLAMENNIYALCCSNGTDKFLKRCTVRLGSVTTWEDCCKLHGKAECLVRFKHYVLIFYTANNVVRVEAYDTMTHKLLNNILSSLDGTCAGMVTFSSQGTVFLVQTNGTVWKVGLSQTNTFDFELVTQLWDTTITITGVAMYTIPHLFLDKNSISAANFYEYLPSGFPFIKYHHIEGNFAMIPMVIPKSWMK